ncbi:MAG: SUMF1/EgtB/PvdO family nonheme iron enzyme [Armatimonadota bacterium]
MIARKIVLIVLLLMAATAASAEPGWIPAQTFMMGSNRGRSDQRPAHPVTLSAYYITPYMVTVRQYCDFLNDSDWDTETDTFIVRKGADVVPEYWSSGVLVNFPYAPIMKNGDNYVPKPGTAKQPMYYVTWEGASLYCNWLSLKEGRTPCYQPDKNWVCDFEADGYHLPTEAQWECAARGGIENRLYPCGSKITDKNANYNNALGHIVDVGSYTSNPYGLYDMAGNVLEWCNDNYKFDYYKECESGVVNPVGPPSGMVRVLRGGAYYQPACFQTCAYRYGTADWKGCFSFNGFRVARQAVSKSQTALTATRTEGNTTEMKMASRWMTEAFGGKLPILFTLDGKSSSKLFKDWKISSSDGPRGDGKSLRTVTARDPKTGIEIACDITTYDRFPAVDWVLRVTNKAAKDSPIIENLQAFNYKFTRPASEKREFILRHSRGSRADNYDFMITDDTLLSGEQLLLGGHGGRPSDYDLPFMNLSWGDGGAVIAIGWSGQWQSTLERDNGCGLQVQAGMQYTHFKLHPGESIRTPRVCLVFWNGDDMLRGHNLFRQFVLAHCNPKVNGHLVEPPIAGYFADLNGYTEANQLVAAQKLGERGFEVQWIDAGWFVGGWPNGAGTWAPRPDCFPNGLDSVGDAVHKAGMKFLLWFEPERVSRGSRIEKEHPEWTVGPITEYGGFFNWGIPEARKWMTDLLSDQITKGGVDIYRQDFNMESLMYLQRSDTANRQGISEIRFVEGMYALWDELRDRHPGLWIDNCASGGRMIDLETTSRAIPLTQSDGPVTPGYTPIMSQLHNDGLNMYIPMHSGCCFGVEPSYEFRSAMTAGNTLSVNPENKPVDEVRKTVELLKQVRPYFEGDYYPLFPHKVDETQWFGYQLDRPDQSRGMVVVFRRSLSQDATNVLTLRGIDSQATYKLTDKDSGETRTIKGLDFRMLKVTIDKTLGSRILFYEKA